MFKTSMRRLQDDQGFTLIELLVVILIIGILAAIALPNFLSQRSRAFDVREKADTRNVQTAIEACYTDTQDYTKCTTATAGSLGTGLGIPLGTAAGQTDIASSDKDGFKITGHSKTGSTFSITKTPGTWEVTRSCVVAPGLGDAGCPNGSW